MFYTETFFDRVSPEIGLTLITLRTAKLGLTFTLAVEL